MEIIAKANFVKVSPRKARLIVDGIKHMSIDEALNTLKIVSRAGSREISKVLKSAVANATANFKLSKENLIIKSITVNEAGSFKRFHPTARGRVHPYKKRMSHIMVILEEKNGKKS